MGSKPLPPGQVPSRPIRELLQRIRTWTTHWATQVQPPRHRANRPRKPRKGYRLLPGQALLHLRLRPLLGGQLDMLKSTIHRQITPRRLRCLVSLLMVGMVRPPARMPPCLRQTLHGMRRQADFFFKGVPPVTKSLATRLELLHSSWKKSETARWFFTGVPPGIAAMQLEELSTESSWSTEGVPPSLFM